MGDDEQSGKLVSDYSIEVDQSKQPKCERCWRRVPDIGTDARWPSVCSRCAEALDAIGFPPAEPRQGEAA